MSSTSARRWGATRSGAFGALRPLVAPLLLTLVGFVLILAGARFASPDHDFAVDDPALRRVFIRLYAVERNETDIFRWSEPLTGVFLYGFDGRPALVNLRLAAPRPPELAPARVFLHAGDIKLGSFEMGDSWRRYHLIAPTRATGETSLLLSTTPYAPDDIDTRVFGVAVSDVRIRGAGEALAPPPVRLAFLLAFPLLGWLLLRRLGAGQRLSMVVGAGLAFGAGLAAAFPATAGYLLPTLGWPAWPVVPLLLLVAWPRIGPALVAMRARTVAQAVIAWAGLGLAFAAIVAMRQGLPWPYGMALLVAGTWAALGLVRTAEPRNEPAGRNLVLLLGGVVAVSLVLRLINLGTMPVGLWRDEARHGIQALQIWADPSYRPIYVVDFVHLPALLFYLMAPVLGLFGPHAWSLRLVSALAGALMPLALFWATAPLVGRRAALFGAVLLAWASWGLSMSRWAFPATLDHLLVLTAFGFAWRSAGASGPRAVAGMALAGFLAGLAVYAYHTGRVAPLALGAVVAIRLGASPAAWRRAAPGLAAAALVGALTVAPLAIFILGDLEGYNRRVGSVALLDSNHPTIHTPANLLLRNLARYGLMFHVEGDRTGRHHMPYVPLFDPASGLLLALGVGVVLSARLRSPGALAVIAFGAIYLLPGLLSDNAPHAMRALGVLAPSALVAGLGLDVLTRGAGNLRSFRPTVGVLLLVVSLAFNTWLYFGVMRSEPEVYGEFDVVETVVGRATAAAPPSVDVYLPEELWSADTVRFLTWNRSAERYTGAPLPAAKAALVLLPAFASPEEQASALAALGADGVALGPVAFFPGTDRPIALAFGRGAEALRYAEGFQP